MSAYFKTCLIGCLLFFLAIPVFSKTDPFFWEQSVYQSNISISEFQSIWVNPSFLAQNQGLDTLFSIAALRHNYMGVSMMAGLPLKGLGLPLDKGSVAVLYQYTFSPELKEIQSTDYLPVQTGSFTDQYHRLSVTAALPFSDTLQVAAVTQVLGRHLYDASALGYSLDLATTWEFLPGLWGGLYSENLLGAPLTWSSSHQETFPTLLHSQVIWTYVDKSVIYGDIIFRKEGIHQIETGANWQLLKSFNLFGKLIFKDDMSLSRFKTGTALTLNKLTLSYMYSVSREYDVFLSDADHILGCGFEF